MTQICPPPPPNTKEYIADVGKILVTDYGKKPYYQPKEVKRASKKSQFYVPNQIDWHCWAMCVFCSQSAFDDYHRITGEICDYASMKIEVLKGLYFGEVLGDTLDGISDFISNIFE